MSIQNMNLKRDFSIVNGGHILYFYTNPLSYVENLLAYIADGLKLGHYVVVIDEAAVYEVVQERLLSKYSKEELQGVFFEEYGAFYGIQTDFNGHKVADEFSKLYRSLPEANRTVQTWARVGWREEPEITSKLEQHEKDSDCIVKAYRMISVCAYDSMKAPADLLIRLLKNHQYFMTDNELVMSPLYDKENIFPSLSTQSKIVGNRLL
ncbi:MEDS domain-containing protein [Paenibacillus cremeus]|uniref:MEDS domain-containing protein n=1 Tax=Paenibacillus cremeus TaxID=2163881 RepID=A0A559JPU9_9BACL|nr:MEDS domain-containing protein [Paenibacillus cremeus]TVY01916.1 hypothetical protein FPZ49_31935 [Paenibacillus cremeus]